MGRDLPGIGYYATYRLKVVNDEILHRLLGGLSDEIFLAILTRENY